MEEKLKEKLAAKFGEAVREIRVPRPRRMYLTIERETLVPLVKFLIETEGLRYLSTITPAEFDGRYEINYHFNLHDSLVLTVKALVPKDRFQPEIESITPLIPGAVFYEREVFDLIGVRAVGHPNLARIALPEDHPENDHPLRKDWKPLHAKSAHAQPAQA